jgi:hypothetical protein
MRVNNRKLKRGIVSLKNQLNSKYESTYLLVCRFILSKRGLPKAPEEIQVDDIKQFLAIIPTLVGKKIEKQGKYRVNI